MLIASPSALLTQPLFTSQGTVPLPDPDDTMPLSSFNQHLTKAVPMPLDPTENWSTQPVAKDSIVFLHIDSTVTIYRAIRDVPVNSRSPKTSANLNLAGYAYVDQGRRTDLFSYWAAMFQLRIHRSTRVHTVDEKGNFASSSPSPMSRRRRFISKLLSRACLTTRKESLRVMIWPILHYLVFQAPVYFHVLVDSNNQCSQDLVASGRSNVYRNR